MSLTRRAATSLIAGGAAAALSSNSLLAAPNSKGKIRLAVSTYSYWHFKTAKYPIEKVIDSAYDLGFDGVELLHRQFESEELPYLNKLRQQAFRKGLDLVMLSIHQDFVTPDKEERAKHVAHTKHCIELAAQLGIPAIRLNSGRWKTIKSFDDLMKVKGDEPALPGFAESDAIGWCVDSIKECIPTAEKHGVMMALENHWGLTTKVDVLLRIHKMVGSPWLGINMDTGNYPGDPYAGIEQLAPFANIIQAKTYHGGGEWYTLDLDYKRIAKIVRSAGYTGYVSLEMEGKEDPQTAVAKSYKTLRDAFGS